VFLETWYVEDSENKKSLSHAQDEGHPICIERLSSIQADKRRSALTITEGSCTPIGREDNDPIRTSATDERLYLGKWGEIDILKENDAMHGAIHYGNKVLGKQTQLGGILEELSIGNIFRFIR